MRGHLCGLIPGPLSRRRLCVMMLGLGGRQCVATLPVRATTITARLNAGATAVVMVRAFEARQDLKSCCEGAILLFDPRCEHSSVPTAGFWGRRAQGCQGRPALRSCVIARRFQAAP